MCFKIIFMDKILKGQMFIVDEFDYEKGSDIEKEFDKIEFYEEYSLSKGTITTDADKKNLHFEIDLGKEFKGTHFLGLLNTDQTITGKIQYTSDTHTSESLVTGHYKINSKNGIIIAGIWEYPDEVKEYFWIELN